MAPVHESSQYSTVTPTPIGYSDDQSLNRVCSGSDNLSYEIEFKVCRKSVKIISGSNPDHIYVRLEDLNKKLEEFHAAMHLYYRECFEVAMQTTWHKDDVCVVRYEGQYYRGVITGPMGTDSWAVHLCDVALDVVVAGSNMGLLCDDFLGPEFTIKCHLADIRPAGGTDSWTAQACEFLQDVFNTQKHFYISKKGSINKARKSMPVILWFKEVVEMKALEPEKSVMHSVNNMLVNNGLALKIIKQGSMAKPLARNNAKSIDTTQSKVFNVKIGDASIKNCDTNFENQDQNIESDKTEASEFKHIKKLIETSSDITKVGNMKKIKRWTDLMEEETATASNASGSLSCMREVLSVEGLGASAPKVLETFVTSFTDWLPPIPFLGTRFRAVATHVNEAGEVYLHDAQFSPLLTQIEVNMRKYFNTLPPAPLDVQWNIGDVCTARYYLNQNWYRGVVTKIKPGSIKVLMVDYGNEEECTAYDMYKRVMYVDIPIFANKIVLHGVCPSGEKWLTSDVDLLHSNVVEKQVDIELKDTGVGSKPHEAIIYLNSVNINEFLARSFSSRDKESKLYDSTETFYDFYETDFVVGCENRSPSKQSSPIPFRDKYIQAELPHEHEFDVIIINVLDYNCIIFELASQERFEANRDLFEEVECRVKSEAAFQPELETFNVGDPCVALYSGDGEWYRAQIFKPPRNDTVHVWFVDFGNTEDVPMKFVRTIDRDWMRLPVDQFIAEISDVALSNHTGTGTVLNHMLAYCGTTKRVQIMMREPLIVRIFNKDDGELAYKPLLDAGQLVLVTEEYHS